MTKNINSGLLISVGVGSVACLIASIVCLIASTNRGLKWTDVNDYTVWDNCFRMDDAKRLKEAIFYGLPINAFYDADGNSAQCRGGEQVEPSRTLVLGALYSRATNCVEVLIGYNADVSLVDARGNNALMYASSLRGATAIAYAEKLCKLHAFNINASNSWSRTALCAAVGADNAMYAKWLIEHGADYNALSANARKTAKRPVVFDAVNAGDDVYALFVELPDVRFGAKDENGCGIVKWLNPKQRNYCDRFDFLAGKLNCLSDGGPRLGVIQYNMSMLGDCRDRVRFLCKYNWGESDLLAALKFAEARGFTNCVQELVAVLRASIDKSTTSR